MSDALTSFSLSTRQKVPVSITFTDDEGKVVTDGLHVAWLSSDTTVATVEADQTGLSANLTAVGSHGSCLLSVTDATSGVACHMPIHIIAEAA